MKFQARTLYSVVHGQQGEEWFDLRLGHPAVFHTKKSDARKLIQVHTHAMLHRRWWSGWRRSWWRGGVKHVCLNKTGLEDLQGGLEKLLAALHRAGSASADLASSDQWPLLELSEVRGRACACSGGPPPWQHCLLRLTGEGVVVGGGQMPRQYHQLMAQMAAKANERGVLLKETRVETGHARPRRRMAAAQSPPPACRQGNLNAHLPRCRLTL